MRPPAALSSSLLRFRLRELLLVALGAVPGAWLRWQCGVLLGPRLGGVGVSDLLVNLAGSFLLGMLAGPVPQRSALLLFGGIGFCGSLTTFSGWLLEVLALLRGGSAAAGWALLLIAPLLGVAAAWLGLLASRAWMRRWDSGRHNRR